MYLAGTAAVGGGVRRKNLFHLALIFKNQSNRHATAPAKVGFARAPLDLPPSARRCPQLHQMIAEGSGMRAARVNIGEESTRTRSTPAKAEKVNKINFSPERKRQSHVNQKLRNKQNVSKANFH